MRKRMQETYYISLFVFRSGRPGALELISSPSRQYARRRESAESIENFERNFWKIRDSFSLTVYLTQGTRVLMKRLIRFEAKLRFGMYDLWMMGPIRMTQPGENKDKYSTNSQIGSQRAQAFLSATANQRADCTIWRKGGRDAHW